MISGSSSEVTCNAKIEQTFFRLSAISSSVSLETCSLRASVCKERPLNFTFEYTGGVCSYDGISFCAHAAKFIFGGTGAVSMILPVRSSVSVRSPSLATTTYVFVVSRRVWSFFVPDPIPIIKMPSAKGSSVPECPILVFLGSNFFI